jgi:protein-disulfide isomerase
MKLARLSAPLSALLLVAPAAQAAEPAVSAAQARAMEAVIHDYLLAHPEVVVEALQRADDANKVKEAAAATQVIATHREALERDPTSPVLGNPAGDVTIVEFFDYRCPYCKAGAPVLEKLLAQDPKIRLVLKELPILGKDSETAARIALVANRHGKGAAYHHAVFALDHKVDAQAAYDVAQSLGLDADTVNREKDSAEISAIIKNATVLAQALSVDGTPTFVIGDAKVSEMPDLDTLQALVTSARKRAS